MGLRNGTAALMSLRQRGGYPENRKCQLSFQASMPSQTSRLSPLYSTSPIPISPHYRSTVMKLFRTLVT